MRCFIYVVVILILLVPNIVWPDSFKCGVKRIKIGVNMAEVLDNCGKPLYTTTQEHSETTTTYDYQGNPITDLVVYTSEIWVYAREIGADHYTYMITFFHGKIVEIERKRR